MFGSNYSLSNENRPERRSRSRSTDHIERMPKYYSESRDGHSHSMASTSSYRKRSSDGEEEIAYKKRKTSSPFGNNSPSRSSGSYKERCTYVSRPGSSTRSISPDFSDKRYEKNSGRDYSNDWSQRRKSSQNSYLSEKLTTKDSTYNRDQKSTENRR